MTILKSFLRLSQPFFVKPALEEWQHLVAIYKDLGIAAYVFEPQESSPDMVFCANQSLPFVSRHSEASALLSNMHDPVRANEVKSIGNQLESLNIKIEASLTKLDDVTFEGMGDALWVPGRKIICGGYGPRTAEKAYDFIFPLLNVHIVLFELSNPSYYHLDTCLSILDDRHVLATRAGFTKNGWDNLKKLFRIVIEVPEAEANSPGFACNAHSPDQRHVVIQRGNIETEAKLRDYGFVPIAVETGEFIKSGGSVFCMKQMFF